MAPRPYHTLLWWQPPHGWTIQFGAFDRSDVEAERQEYRSHGTYGKHLRIITTKSSRQSEIDEAVAKLNQEADPQ